MQPQSIAHSAGPPQGAETVEVAVVQIPPEHIAAVLPKTMTRGGTVLSALEDMQEWSHGDVMVDQFLAAVAVNTEQLWLVWDGQIHAVIGTAIENTGTGERQARIRLCVGQEGEHWVPAVLAEIEAWARHHQADRICIAARPGWMRQHLKHFRPRYVELVRELRA